MKNSVLACMFALILSCAGMALGEVTLKTDFEVTARVASEYIWRGQVVSDKPCFQPELILNASGFALDLWGTWPLSDDSDSPENTRMDISLDYTEKIENDIYKMGLVSYVYHDDPKGVLKDTFEVFVDYTADVLLLPSVRIYYDFVEVDGFYVSFRMAHSLPVYEKVADLDLSASVGWADKSYVNAWVDKNYDILEAHESSGQTNLTGQAIQNVKTVPDKSGLVDLTLSASLPIVTEDRITVTPGVKYMMLLDSGIRNAVKDADRKTSGAAFSLSVSMAF